MAFILLSGTPPFYAEDNFALFEQIKSCKYSFEENDAWLNVSDCAKDFISRILVADPKQRMTLEQMMEHKWMKIELERDANLAIDKGVLQAMLSVGKDTTD